MPKHPARVDGQAASAGAGGRRRPLRADALRNRERVLEVAFTAFAAATHSATLGVLFGLCCLGWIARPLLPGRFDTSRLVHGTLTIAAGALMLLAANFALSGQWAWTPGGTGVAF